MRTARALRHAGRALSAHRTRAALAVASVAVGVAAVVVTGALGAGARAEVLSRVDGMGTNLLVVRTGAVTRQVARRSIAGAATTLTLEDAARIARLPFVASAAPGIDGGARIEFGGRSMTTRVLGTTPEFQAVRRLTVRAGRFLEAGDDADRRRVVVAGATVARTLFPDGDAVGREIRVRGVPYEVVGVLEEKGVLADGSDQDNQILVPVRTALRRILNTNWITVVFVSVRDPARMADAGAAVGQVLATRAGAGRGQGADVEIQDTARFVRIQQQTADWLATLSVALSGLALGIGGTGVLGLMLMSVRERTTEIGVRRAVGATRADIVRQFMMETTLLASAGALAGIAVGAMASAALARGTAWPLAFPVDALRWSLGTVGVIGLGFGALPAARAASIPPMGAIRRD